MLGVRLESVDNSNARYEKVGTCEYCMSSKYCVNPLWTLSFPDGSVHTFKAYSRAYNGYRQILVDNYLDFSDWLSGFDFDVDSFLEDEYEYVNTLADYYYPKGAFYSSNDGY